MEILILLLETEEAVDDYYYCKDETERGHRMVFAEHN
jgi:hypothetical protein